MKTAASIDIKVYSEDHRSHETFRFQCPRGHRYTKDGAMMEMSAFVSDLQERVPGKIFKVVRLALNKFAVVHEVGQA